MDLIFLASRILFGGFWLISGINHFRYHKAMETYVASKRIVAPSVAVYGTGVMLVLAGIGILLGIYVPLAVALLVLFLLPVTFLMHNYWAIDDPAAKAAEKIMFSKNLALLGAALAYLFISLPWPMSLLS